MLQASLPPSPQAGGVGYQVDLLARALTRRGHRVTVFVVDDPPLGTPYECSRVNGGQGRGRHFVGVGRAFAGLDLSGFDAVHAHGDDWLFGRRRRVRTFYGSALMEARTATRWLRRGSQLYYYGLEWISSSTNRHCVAISETTRRYLPLVRTCIPCGYDPAIFFPGGERTPYPSMLFVSGTLEGRKRGDLLLATFARIRQDYPNARLTIVSPDRADGPGITCVSNLDAGDLGCLYRSHWMLCSTSSYEGFGVPYVEALASGLPIVTTLNHGAAEVLRYGQLGVLSPPGQLWRALEDLIDDASRRRALTETGIQAAQSYSIDVVAERYESMYGELLPGPPAPGRATGQRCDR